MIAFERFVGIDWSGARGATQAGIQIAQIEANASALQLVSPPNGRRWSRCDAMEYIIRLIDKPTLVGIDFAFSIPWSTDCLSFAGRHVGDVRALWALVESICEETPNLYAGPIWTMPDSPFRQYIFHHLSKHTGEKYDRLNRRMVEKVEGNAISVYHMAGPQVGAGSFSGMRMLNTLTKCHGDTIAIWPFDLVDGTKTAVVEIYPSFFYRQAGAKRPTKKESEEANRARVEKVLEYYGAARPAGLNIHRSVDQSDAAIAAAALRKLANGSAFDIPLSRDFDLREGWIFGVPFDTDLVSP